MSEIRSICRGCGVVFVPKPGSAGQYCTRACYTNPERLTRSRNATPRQYFQRATPAAVPARYHDQYATWPELVAAELERLERASKEAG